MAQHLQQQQQQRRAAPQAIPQGMQFRYNSDFPSPPPGYADAESAASGPAPFPPAQIDPCARLTTRVYVPRRNQVVVVRDVLVGTLPPGAQAGGGGAASLSGGGGGGGAGGGGKRMSWADEGGGDGSDDDDDSDDSWDDTDSDMDEDDGDGGFAAAPPPPPPPPPMSAAEGTPGVRPAPPRREPPKRAYWLQRTLREAIYGRVKYAVVLRRRSDPSLPPPRLVSADGSPVPAAEWEVTEEKCAVKEMSWNHIRRERDRLAEDPIKEVSAMQYLSRYHRRLRDELLQSGGGGGGTTMAGGDDDGDRGGGGADAMMDTHIMMPLDLLSDDRYLYSIMPYCNGGELFDRLDERQKFTEEESRYWMHQILDGVENLQRAGVCHRDMSLENLLVHDERLCLIIDMGMCLRIPYDDSDCGADGAAAPPPTDTVGMMASFAEMSVDGGLGEAGVYGDDGGGGLTIRERLDRLDCRRRGKRFLVRPQGTCGKWHYMSPEIAQNRVPFDGHAVDMWAAGVILFLMLTGFPPWERPCKSDDRFKYMTAGYLVQMLTEWELGLSPDAMDLLQRMLWIDPRDRLSLEQVRAHPWMANGRRELPARPRAAAFAAGGTRG